MNNQMNPSDFIFHYKTDKFGIVDNFLSKYGLNAVQVQFLTALVGSNNNVKVPLSMKDETSSRSFSRTVFSKNAPEMERNYGLITILNNPDEEYNELLNKKAFLKNTNGEKFLDLDNVNNFYQSFLGGIEILYDRLSEYGHADENDMFNSLSEYLNEDENIQIMEEVSKQVSVD